jgi:hypothetical protein
LVGIVRAQTGKQPRGFEGVIEYTIQTNGSYGEQFKDFWPKGASVTLKGGKMAVRYTWSQRHPRPDTLPEFVFDGENNILYHIRHDLKRTYEKKLRLYPVPDSLRSKRYSTNPRPEMVAGYSCTIYHDSVEVVSLGGRMLEWVWATPQIQLGIPKEVLEQTGSFLFADEMKGFPLKKVLQSRNYELQFIIEAKKIQPRKVDTQAVSPPAAYELRPLGL